VKQNKALFVVILPLWGFYEDIFKGVFDMFISIEGGEGVGKSTFARRLAQTLMPQYRVILTRDHNGKVLGDFLGEWFTSQEYETTILLQTAARYEHVQKWILPALESGYIVICDQYIDTTLVYQGFLQNNDMQLILDLHNRYIRLFPHLTFLLDVDPAIAQQRIRKPHISGEPKPLAFHERVREGFLTLAHQYDRIVRLDASLPTEAIVRQATSYLHQCFKVVI
jgi:dTMP kinase